MLQIKAIFIILEYNCNKIPLIGYFESKKS